MADYDDDQGAADLGIAKVEVVGTTLGTVKAGSRICRVSEGFVVAHPDDPPYLLHWSGARVELKATADGAIIMPPVAGLDSMSVNLTVAAFFETVGFDSGKWLTREQQLIEDLRAATRHGAVHEITHRRVAELVGLCRRALDVLEDVT